MEQVLWTHYRKTPPAQLPVSVREVKESLRLPADDFSHDENLGRRIAAATEKWENETDRPCMDQVFVHQLDKFFDYMLLFKRPVHQIVEIRYQDTDNVQQVLDPSVYALTVGDSAVYKVHGMNWPEYTRSRFAVEIEYIAGHGTTVDLVPYAYKEAIISQVMAWWEDPIVGERYQQAYDRIKDQLSQSRIWG